VPRWRGQPPNDERVEGLDAARVAPQGALEGPRGAAGVSSGGAGPGAQEPSVREEGRGGRRRGRGKGREACCCCCYVRSGGPRGAVKGDRAVLVGPQVEETGAVVFAVVVVVVACLFSVAAVASAAEAVEDVFPPPQRRQALRREQPHARVRALSRGKLLPVVRQRPLECREGAARVAGEEVGVGEQGGVGCCRA